MTSPVTREFVIAYGDNKMASVGSGNGIYTFFGSAAVPAWAVVGMWVRASGFSNANNNGIFRITAVGATSITTTNTASVADGSPAAAANVAPCFGGTTDFQPEGQVLDEDGYDIASAEFKVLVQNDTEATFAALCNAFEEAFRIPRQDFVWLQGSATMKTLSHRDNTGFDSSPRITKREDKGNTGRSRLYTVRIEFGRPANAVRLDQFNSAPAGRRYSTINVSYTPARKRRFTITGVYTVIPGSSNTARAQYEAVIAAYVTSVLNGLGLSAGGYELAEEPRTEHNETNKVIEFTRVYDELIYSQVGGALDDTAIVRQDLKITRDRISPGDTPTAERLVTVTASYSAWIDKTVTQDLRGKYDDIRVWLVGQCQTTVGASQIALVEDRPEFDYVENRITATLVMLASTGSQLIENRITTEIEEQFGTVLVPAWSGNKYGKYRYQGPARKVRTTTQVARMLGSGGGGSGGGGGGGGAPGGGAGFAFPGGGFLPIFGGSPAQNAAALGFGGANFGPGPGFGAAPGGGAAGGGGSEAWAPISFKRSDTPMRMGLDGQIIDVTDFTTIFVEEYYVPVSGGSLGEATPGGGGAPVAT